LSCDPKLLIDGVNIYKYTDSNPISFLDKEGFNGIHFELDDPGDCDERRLKNATERVVTEIQHELSFYFGIETNIKREAGFFSKGWKRLSLEVSEDKSLQAESQKELETKIIAGWKLKWYMEGKSKAYINKEIKNRLKIYRKTRKKIEEYLNKDEVINIKTINDRRKPLFLGSGDAFFGKSVDLNPFAWTVKTKSGKWAYTMKASSREARIRMGPTIIILHEFQHLFEFSQAENIAMGMPGAKTELDTTVKNVNDLIKFHPFINKRTEYRGKMGQRFYGLKNILYPQKEEWLDFPTAKELTTGFKRF
jgi:hypothetical protein